jgi:hypothetical protein
MLLGRRGLAYLILMQQDIQQGRSRKDANAGDRRELNHEDTKNTKKDCLTQRRKDANARDRRELNHEGAKQKKQKIRQD